MTLPGIGEAKAEKILRYREEHGAFRSIEDVMQIEGIKEGVFNKIKEDITIYFHTFLFQAETDSFHDQFFIIYN